MYHILSRICKFSSVMPLLKLYLNKKIHDRLLRIIFFRIGLGIAKKLVSDGAKVMISSRKASNVEEALKSFPEKEISGLK